MRFFGTELDFDLFDADFAGAYETAVSGLTGALSELPEDMGLEATVRAQCGLIFDFFDGLFGAGTSGEIFGGSVNLRSCIAALREFNDIARRQRREFDAMRGGAAGQ